MADQNLTSKGHIGRKNVAVVIVPLPAQGHLNQLLHLSRLISLYNIPVHFVGTTAHNRQAKLRVQGFDPLTMTNSIQFHDFPTPSFDTPSANPNASHKFPSHLLPSFYATFHFREPVCSLVRELLNTSTTASDDLDQKVVVIYDFVMSWVVQDLATIPNVECYSFNCTSAFQSYSHFWEAKGKPVQPGTELYEGTPSIENSFPAEFLEFYKIHETFAGKISCGEIYNSSRVIEGLYLDLVSKEFDGLNQWAIGPFNPLDLIKERSNNHKRHASLDWLDNQEENSVIFVSFGTTTSLCDEEIQELAIGLEKSQQKFIWVLRDADKGDVVETRRALQLPEGYEERIKRRGIIMRDWAPQLEILAHASTGGFMSHCGWNSCMESISLGVPIAAWPMHADQPKNSQLITKYLKIGLTVKQWTRDELVTSGMIKNAVRTLMASAEGDDMRKRAKSLSNAIKILAMDAGAGSNSAEMDSFIAHITQ